MPTCLLNVVKILAMRAPMAVSSTALICIKWESFNWVSHDSCQVLLSVCYKMGKSRATDPPSLAHSLFNTIQSLSLSFTSFSRQTCLAFTQSFLLFLVPVPLLWTLFWLCNTAPLDGPCFCTLYYSICFMPYAWRLAGGGFSVCSHVLQ